MTRTRSRYSRLAKGSTMMSKKIYFIILSILVIVFVVTQYENFIPETPAYKISRQILQVQKKSNEVVTEIDLFYVHEQRNNTGSLADVYLNEKLKKPKNFNKTCAKFPDFFDLQFKNDHWQMQKTSNGTFYLFNAYVDDRLNGSVVRIVGMYDVYRPKTKFYCQFWYQNSVHPRIVQTETLLWLFREKWGADKGYFIHPYLITCPWEVYQNQTPVSVSLVQKPCDHATNNLKIFFKELEEKKNFVVCVKGLSFPSEDRTTRLAEWIELVHILGAEKINFYEFSVHPKTQRVLDYYIARGIVELTPLTIVGDVSNHPFLQNRYLQKKVIQRRLQEVITFNDCLYKHIQEFKYVVLLDTDEVIVPAEGTWVSLLQTLQKTYPNVSSYMARNVYFIDTYLHQHDWFEGIPKYMHMLQHVYRTKNYTKPGYFVKAFHDTSKVLALHNHFPIGCLKGCMNKEMDVKLAQLQHYRVDCAAGVSNCKEMKEVSVLDTRVWNYKEEVIRRVEHTLEKLRFSYT